MKLYCNLYWVHSYSSPDIYEKYIQLETCKFGMPKKVKKEKYLSLVSVPFHKQSPSIVHKMQ